METMFKISTVLAGELLIMLLGINTKYRYWDQFLEEEIPNEVLSRLQRPLFLDKDEIKRFKQDQEYLNYVRYPEITHPWDINDTKYKGVDHIPRKNKKTMPVECVPIDESAIEIYKRGHYKYYSRTKHYAYKQKWPNHVNNPNIVQHLHMIIPEEYISHIPWDWLEENVPDNVVLKYSSPTWTFTDYFSDTEWVRFYELPKQRNIIWGDYISIEPLKKEEQEDYLKKLGELRSEEKPLEHFLQRTLINEWLEKETQKLMNLEPQLNGIEEIYNLYKDQVVARGWLRPSWSQKEIVSQSERKMMYGYIRIENHGWKIQGYLKGKKKKKEKKN